MELRQIHLREEVRDNDSSWPDGRRRPRSRKAVSITATDSFLPPPFCGDRIRQKSCFTTNDAVPRPRTGNRCFPWSRYASAPFLNAVQKQDGVYLSSQGGSLSPSGGTSENFSSSLKMPSSVFSHPLSLEARACSGKRRPTR